jgi:hypothetical protein
LPAELVATPSALFFAWAAANLTGTAAAAAVAATWGENLAFYGMMLGRELAERGGLRALPAALRDLFLEFGPTEALDSFVLTSCCAAARSLPPRGPRSQSPRWPSDNRPGIGDL